MGILALQRGEDVNGESVTWDAAPGVVRNGLTAAGSAGGFQWLVGGAE